MLGSMVCRGDDSQLVHCAVRIFTEDLRSSGEADVHRAKRAHCHYPADASCYPVGGNKRTGENGA